LDCKPDNIFLIHTDSFQINNILKGFFGNYNPFTKIKCYETVVISHTSTSLSITTRILDIFFSIIEEVEAYLTT